MKSAARREFELGLTAFVRNLNFVIILGGGGQH
jgi:hypothetical protein